MKVYYFNDERAPMRVRILDVNYDAATATGDSWATLAPASGQIFDVALPEGAALYVKKWPGMVMISYISQAGLAQFEEAPLKMDPA